MKRPYAGERLYRDIFYGFYRRFFCDSSFSPTVANVKE